MSVIRKGENMFNLVNPVIWKFGILLLINSAGLTNASEKCHKYYSIAGAFDGYNTYTHSFEAAKAYLDNYNESTDISQEKFLRTRNM
jgi:hypothetical protein